MDGLSIICAGLGVVEEDDNGNRIGYTKGEYCLDNLKDLLRFLRRDDPQTREVFKQVCKWKIVGKDLIPIIEHCQEDRNLVLNAVKVLVFLTMPVEPTSSDIPQQMEYLWGLKSSITLSNTIPVIVSLLETPLENLENEAFTEEDWKLVQLLLTLFRNILAVQYSPLHQKAGASATHFLSLRDKFLELLFHENVMELILSLTQYIGGSSGYLRQDNLLLLETLHYIFAGQEPELIAKAYSKASKVDGNHRIPINSLSSIMEEEEERRKLIRIRNLGRNSQFSGTFTRLTVDGSKTLFKGNPLSGSSDAMLKSHKGHRGTLKRMVWDHEMLPTTRGNIMELLHDFVKQLLSGGYSDLMQSIRTDIEKEHQNIQNSDIVIFFQVAQFVTSFQYHISRLSEPKSKDDPLEESANHHGDGTFSGNICGPIAATMNESMFLLVISKWRYAYDGLKETNDYKFVSAAGSLMKFMIRMLDLVLKESPENCREPQTARILLYKLFYDQTDQGMTQFLLNQIKSFDTHKQPKSDFADLLETVHVVIRLMENLQARGTLRVSKKSRKKRGKKNVKGGDTDNPVEDHAPSQNESNSRSCEESAHLSTSEKLINTNSDEVQEGIALSADADGSGKSESLRQTDATSSLSEKLTTSSCSEADGKETNIPFQVGACENNDFETPINECNLSDVKRTSESENLSMSSEKLIDPSTDAQDEGTKQSSKVGESEAHELEAQKHERDLPESKKSDGQCDELHEGDDDSSDDEQQAVTYEVDFKVSTLVSALAHNSIIQNLCWLLKFYRSNPASTNHYIICMLRKICEDLELSPMLYQLSFLNIFYHILAEQKTSPSKEYENVVQFLTSLVRRMLRKMKKQPLLFVEVLFWKTRKECHYINCESLMNEVSNLRKESQNWDDVPNEGGGGFTEGKGWVRRSLADALGDDEADLIMSNVSDKPNRMEDDPSEVNIHKDLSTSGGGINQKDFSNSERLLPVSEVPKRRKNLVLDEVLEERLRDLYEKYKSDRYCSRLIAKDLDPDGNISALQVTSKLRQLGLKVLPKKRMLQDGVSNQSSEEGAPGEENSHHNKNELKESSGLGQPLHSRKRVRAFSEDQEMKIKSLFEQFKGHKRCSHMIANALETDGTFTAAQVSRKLKQLGLRAPQKKRTKENMQLRDEDLGNSAESSGNSDDETLLSLRKRSNHNKIEKEGEMVNSAPEGMLSDDRSDDEVIISALRKKTKRLPSKNGAEVSVQNAMNDIDMEPANHTQESSERSKHKIEKGGEMVNSAPEGMLSDDKSDDEVIISAFRKKTRRFLAKKGTELPAVSVQNTLNDIDMEPANHTQESLERSKHKIEKGGEMVNSAPEGMLSDEKSDDEVIISAFRKRTRRLLAKKGVEVSVQNTVNDIDMEPVNHTQESSERDGNAQLSGSGGDKDGVTELGEAAVETNGTRNQNVALEDEDDLGDKSLDVVPEASQKRAGVRRKLRMVMDDDDDAA